MKKVGKPLCTTEIVSIMRNDKSFTLNSKTPNDTIGASLYLDIRDNPNSIFCQVSIRPVRFFLKNLSSKDVRKPVKQVSEKRELIYAIEMFHSSFGDTIIRNIKIGHTINIKGTVSGYKRGNENCKVLGLWYANPEIKVTDCEKGIHKIANKCGHRQKRETFVFINSQFDDFVEYVNLMLLRVQICV